MIDRVPFGATGHESSRAIFGAAALARVSKRDADRALELLIEYGVNHIDVAASYGDADPRRSRTSLAGAFLIKPVPMAGPSTPAGRRP